MFLLGGISGDFADAAIITYEFTGQINSARDLPFGRAFTVGKSVTGRFSYDTNSVASHFFATSTGFAQNQPGNGISAIVDGATVDADRYLMVMGDNVVQPLGGTFDNLSISYSSAFNPGLGAPLYVDGVAQNVGQFRLVFTAASTLFSGVGPSLLPLNLTMSNFLSGQGIFSDSTTIIRVSFAITSLKMVPEPGTQLLFLAGMFLIAVVGKGRRKA